MKDIKNRLYISGMDPKGDKLARKYQLGFEIVKFAWAAMLDDPGALEEVRSQMEGNKRFWLHAPFAELTPCAIDPMVRDVVKKRYEQTIKLSSKLGINRIVIHDGFYPVVYFPEWFIEQSVIFWKEFLKTVPEDFQIALENVMDDEPSMLAQIVEEVNDQRLGICFDIGHANTYISDIPLDVWMEAFKPHLFHLHLHNNEGERDIHSQLGKGTIDMRGILDSVLDTDATMTIETMEGQESIDWLIENGYLADIT